MALQLVITNAGRAAVIDQAKGGFRAVRIAAVGVSPTAVTAAATATALPDEVKRITTIAGEATATDVTHLTVTDESGDSYTVRSFALYLSDGTLFALYGQPDAIVQKSAQALLLLAIDVALSSIPAAQLTFGNANFTNPAATQTRAGVIEIADDDEELAATDRTRALTPRSLNRAIRRGVGGRPVDFDNASGAMTIRGDANGWETGYFFRGASGATVGGFGALGGGNSLSYFYVGSGYQAANALRVYPSRVSFGDDTIWHAGNDGAGSGLDADLLDGWHRDDVRDWNNQLNRPASVWHAGNDGAGSGLDADLLDGRHADAFLIRNTGQRPLDYDDVTGAMTIRGDTGGWAVGYNVRDADGTWLGGFGALGGASALRYFFIGTRFDDATAFRVYPTRVSWGDNTIWHAGNDGAGSGLDADLLDGRDGSAYALLAGATFVGPISANNAGSTTTPAAQFVSLGAGTTMRLSSTLAGSSDVDLNPFIKGVSNAGFELRINGTRLLSIAAGGGSAFSGALTRDGASVWDAGNDGAGSGLDADLLHGWERDAVRDWNNILNRPAAFPPVAHTHGAADLAGAFTGALSDDGYTVLPNGLILQWVTGAQQAAGSETAQTVTFPIAFNSCFQVIAATHVTYADKESHAIYQLISFTNEAATVMRQLVSTAATDSAASWPRLFAIGR